MHETSILLYNRQPLKDSCQGRHISFIRPRIVESNNSTRHVRSIRLGHPSAFHPQFSVSHCLTRSCTTVYDYNSSATKSRKCWVRICPWANGYMTISFTPATTSHHALRLPLYGGGRTAPEAPGLSLTRAPAPTRVEMPTRTNMQLEAHNQSPRVVPKIVWCCTR